MRRQVCHVTAKREGLIEIYRKHCESRGLRFTLSESVMSPDPSTLFTTSGMQKLKKSFSDINIRRTTLSDVQTCLRLNDLEEIGDGTHYLDFQMLGLFSFRHWSLKQGVDFWLEFLDSVGVYPDTVTIHPDRSSHRSLYEGVPVMINNDSNCIWSDGGIGGYCTEFYKDGIELGNIVIPLGECLDCGFGLERIGGFMKGWSERKPDREEVLRRCVNILLKEGIFPCLRKQGYVLRKLVRICDRENIELI